MKIMNFLRLAAISAALFAAPAQAQQWVDYVNPDYRFRINFPSEPALEEISYTGSDGTALTAHRFSAARGAGIYAVTVVAFPRATFFPDDELNHAAEMLSRRGTLLYEGPTLYDGIPVLESSVRAPDGRQIMATILAHDRYLHIVEAEVGADDGPPVQFTQSVIIVDAEGNRVEIDH